MIVVDDASTDHTESVVKAFSDARLHYERLVSNVGGAEARNCGIRMARGEYIAFQDSDDEWCCTKLESAVGRLKASPHVGGVFSAFIQTWDSGCRQMPLWSGLENKKSLYEKLLWRNVVDTPTVVVRRSCLDEAGGFDAQMPRYQDWDLGLRLTAVTTLEYLKDPLIVSHVTDGSISHDQKAHATALQILYEKNRGAIDKDRALKAAWLHRLGDARMLVGDLRGRRMLLAAWLKHPFSVRVLVKALLSLLPGRQTYSLVKTSFSR